MEEIINKLSIQAKVIDFLYRMLLREKIRRSKKYSYLKVKIGDKQVEVRLSEEDVNNAYRNALKSLTAHGV